MPSATTFGFDSELRRPVSGGASIIQGKRVPVYGCGCRGAHVADEPRFLVTVSLRPRRDLLPRAALAILDLIADLFCRLPGTERVGYLGLA